MIKALAKLAYNVYYVPPIHLLGTRVSQEVLRSSLVVKLIFGMRILSKEELSVYFSKPPIYFGLTTYLLATVLRRRLRELPSLKLLEIGVGAYAVLSGYLSRFGTQTVDAIDIDPACIESAQKHVELNQVGVRVFQSDLFSNIPAQTYDLIFWNMPYTELPPHAYLPRLFEAVPDFMNKNAQLLLSYGTKTLPRETILQFLNHYPPLRVDEVKTWAWNVHEVISIGLAKN
ncbi:methyltransferase [Myxacorys almedinensis]|uniref:Methyltransferase n=1 Tax=Myxacorys almedinensis A TaxID=2690445 RepID=A0A8J7Z7M7_9CYAN|nr:methyltransferase [Myxacorys almedinensis]NDJ17893.1 methyltransferase [Myxacorys almedinensis A]